jgi:hypothetical protein
MGGGIDLRSSGKFPLRNPPNQEQMMTTHDSHRAAASPAM